MTCLFLCSWLLPAGVIHGEDPIPETWVKEAREYESSNYRNPLPLVPKYEKELIRRIREHILATRQKEHADYRNEIPETGVPYDMVAITGGKFLMGSPETEETRNLDEGPQREIEVSDFWIGKFEVTWDQFQPYALRSSSDLYTKIGTPKEPETIEELVHWISSPTVAYMEMDFGMGMHDGFPAICMTHHAASKFCQWLSLQTGHFYRLPTEAEWEYACRAGTTGPFSCPANQLAEFGVMDPEQVRIGYEKVGTKKPNPWGLFDMHGNVLEWCLDAYLPGYGHLARKNPYHPPKQRFGRVFRGGSWYDPPEYLRSAARACSTEDLQVQDPQLPKSLWWLTDAHWLGFRLARTSNIPSEEEMMQIWNSGSVYHKKGDRKFNLQ